MIGDSANLSFLMWRSRHRIPALAVGTDIPKATADEMNRLANNLLTQAFPDPSERRAAFERFEQLTPEGVERASAANQATPAQ